MRILSKHVIVGLLSLIGISAAFSQQRTLNLTKYVDPFIGTLGDGNVFAGACLPHGFVKLGPDTKVNSGAAGYKRKEAIFGFSHLHISGMGGPLYGNIQLMPTTGAVNCVDHSSFPSNEKASPGYYTVALNKYNTVVQLTSTAHVGFHRYIFPQGNTSHILVDVGATLYGVGPNWNSSIPVGGEVYIDNSKNAVCGYGTYKGARSTKKPWKVFFYAIFDTRFKSFGTWRDTIQTMASNQVKGNKIGAILNFDTQQGQAIMIKVGISMISIDNAKQSIEQEIPHWDFDQIKAQANAKWEKEMDKIEVKGISEKDYRVFYTAMYHGLLMPTDWTGQNPGLKKNQIYYDDFLCLWDIYRTVGPLLTLISTKQYADMLNTLLGFYKRDGWLPDAHSSLQREFIQVGTSADMLFADAYLKDIKGINYNEAYEAIRKNGTDTSFKYQKVVYSGRVALPDYLKNHYVSVDTVYHYAALDTSWRSRKCSVSKSLEYTYGDYSIYEMAKGLGKTEDARMFKERSMWYENLFDNETRKMRGRYADGTWIKPYYPAVYDNKLNYYEGNGYTWTYFVPHDISGLINLFGGNKPFVDSLSNAISNHYEAFNEPGMLQIYLFTWAHRPDLTQQFLRKILKGSFNDTDNGLPGNDDSGTTSSWYLWSRMGIYPVAGQNLYIIGSPSQPETTIHMESGRDLKIIAKNASEENIYIQSAKLNGKTYNKSFFTQDDIKNGAIFEFLMGNKPSLWGSQFVPPSLSEPQNK